ncbi:hypothetical protein QWL27_24835 [Streptomyces thermocarboxydus]|uniref:hypothetical protein n=1 Tax=Streptomyces TaxID=1883 RepID=UPI000D616ACE|nr:MULTISPECIES: hypothetical protein [unclassified Streptomyces]MCP8712416.1 hypothetical protein [Streptomyces sp. AC04842]MDN3288958.1 hypothetical protein [Streptomyces thermocarboxydus]PWE07441.1 hypothetical protein DD630_10895 [Streptomyces sp. BSE7F]WSB89038.1 hypothetical protein OHA60_11730 [Streptomyces cellulosae]MBJ6646162.1 hypothetical protein [Streptomyces sp. BSE7-9]
MTYLAVFEDKSRGVRRADLIAALERDWPTAVILERQGSQKSRDVVWSYTNDSQELEGYSHVDGTCIYLDSPLALAARFALWYRGLVPAEIDLVFCDDGYSFDGSIEAGMSVDDVIAIAADS